MRIITSAIPAEFGGRNAGVVIIQPNSGIDQNIKGSVRAGAGDFRARDLAAAFGSNFGKNFGFFVNAATNRSDRFLDPVDLRNFNNRGGAVNLSLRADWHPTGRDTTLFDLSGNGTDFRAPNDLLQVELMPWEPRFEIAHRSVVPAPELLARLWMGEGFEPIYHRALVEAGLV